MRAMSRKPGSPASNELKEQGAEIVGGDLGDRDSVERAAKGVDVAFLVATPYEQGVEAENRFGKTGLDGFHSAGVPYIVYSSVSDADRRTGIPHFDSKAEIEQRLKGLGVEYSIVAPVFFTENLLAPWLAAGIALGVLATGVLPDRKLQVISLPEIAEFTALAVEQPRSFRGKRINIASDELTPTEIVGHLSEVTGRKLTYHPLPLDQVSKESEDLAKMYDWFNRVGYSADIPKLKHEYPQVHWHTFREWSRLQDWPRALTAATKT